MGNRARKVNKNYYSKDTDRDKAKKTKGHNNHRDN